MALQAAAIDFQYTYQGNTLTYTVIDEDAKTVQVATNTGASGDLVIPETVENEGVTFTVIKIRDRAFTYCTDITSVTFPNTLTSIGGWAFYGCSGISSIEIPELVTKIDMSTFEFCSGLQSVTIPSSVTEISNSAFRYCSSLTAVSLPESITSIAGYAFSDCSSLISITIPASVKLIGDAAFKDCPSLEEIIVEQGNKFYCSADGVLLSNDRTDLLSYPAGKACDDYLIPNTVTTICPYSFSGCVNLKSVTIPGTVTSINERAFYNCNGLESITLPESITSILMNTFQDCSKLKSVVIPNSVKEIESHAFYNCKGLTSCIIGSGVTTLGEGVFFQCENLTKIVALPTVPPEVNYWLFFDVPRTAEIFVPKACLEDYKYIWVYFENFIGMGELNVDLSATEISIDVDKEAILKADITMEDDQAVESIVWTNTAPDVASYDEATGEVKGIADGISEITCKVIDKYGVTHSATCNVKVGTGVNGIVESMVDTPACIDFTARYEVFDLTGKSVADTIDGLVPGTYIIRQGNAVKKVAVK